MWRVYVRDAEGVVRVYGDYHFADTAELVLENLRKGNEDAGEKVECWMKLVPDPNWQPS